MKTVAVLLLTLLSGGCILIDVDDTRTINFAGYSWQVKDGYLAPGRNHFSDSESNVFVDDNGDLHLKIEQRNGTWYTSEVIADRALGYGRYLFQLDGRIDQLDPQMILGLFTWDTDPAEHHREIDFEFSRWGNQNATENAQYVVQPFDVTDPQHKYAFNLSLTGDFTTHVLYWSAGEIRFETYGGHRSLADLPESPVQEWTYPGQPPSPGNAKIRMNFYLYQGEAPQNSTGEELVIKDFQFSSN